jgi:hypothetical protein
MLYEVITTFVEMYALNFTNFIMFTSNLKQYIMKWKKNKIKFHALVLWEG